MPASYITSYAALRRAKPPSLRARARHVALSGLSTAARLQGALRDTLARPRVHFLYLHHIFSDEEAALRTLLDALAPTHTFVSYSEAVALLTSPVSLDRPYLALSSDDGFKNNLNAARVLADYGLSACFFVCPDIVSASGHEAYAHYATERFHFPPIEFMDWDDVEQLLGAGHEIGNHTRDHPDLGAIPLEEARDQIESAHEVLRDRLGNVEHFSWPYGRFHHFDTRLLPTLQALGYRSVASAERGAHVKAGDEAISASHLCLRRDHIVLGWPLDHILYFMARSAREARPSQHGFPHSV